jgi:glycerol kinase
MTTPSAARILVIDVGTTGLRAAVVDEQLRIVDIEYRPNPPSVPFDGLVEFDARLMADKVLEAAHSVLGRLDRPVDAVGITCQRASTVVWDRASGEPVAMGLGWQDLRTITECITAKAERGWNIAPNQSITKLASILGGLGDSAPTDLAFGTVDSWIAWVLTDGAVHVSDGTNMSTTTTGMRTADGSSWADDRLDAFGIPHRVLPQVVDSSGVIADATALPGSPPIAALVGDQQGSLIGQACTRAGLAKLTLGTGGMLDMFTGAPAPTEIARNDAGTYALPTWQLDGALSWGAEGIMLSAGTNIEWLRDDLRLIDTPAESHDVASGCADAGGVVYVPALLGLGTPRWDYGARGTLLGLTLGTERSHIVRAVLDGIAQRSADLLDAATSDTGVEVDTLRIDGGMSANPTLVQTLADVTGRQVEVSPVSDATTVGAAFLAGLAIGTWTDLSDIESLWNPAHTVAPSPTVDRAALRSRWGDALERAGEWHSELSALEF